MIALLYFLIVSVVTAMLLAYVALRYATIEMERYREFKVRVKARFSRLVGMYRISALFFSKPFTYVIIITLILAIIIAGSSSSAENRYVELKDSTLTSKTREIYIKFNNPVPSDVCLHIKQYVGLFDECVKFYRITLESPYRLLNLGKDIYCLIGSDRRFLSSLLSINLSENMYAYSDLNTISTYDELLYDNLRTQVNLIYVDPAKLSTTYITYKVPLIPVQAYIGTEPVTIPARYVLITTIENLMNILESQEELVTDVLIKNVTDLKEVNVLELYKKLSMDYDVAEVRLVEYGRVVIVSNTEIPTLKSVSTALITSIIASLISLSVFSSAIPHIRDLRDKVSYLGFPPWAMFIILTNYTITSMLFPGIAALVYVYLTYGGTATFNSLLTLTTVWLASTVYLNLKTKPESLASESYIPPTTRYVLTVKCEDVEKLVNTLVQLIKSNEFFEVEDVDYKIYYNKEVVMNAKMFYIDSWGSGVNLTIFINVEKGFAHINISTSVFGVEEISESMGLSINSLVLSKIVGGVKAWEHTY